MLKKRGQGSTGGSAAGLVAIIAGLLVVYILFLPPSERSDLLDKDYDDEDNDYSSTRDIDEIKILLDEDVGRIDYLRGDEFEIDIPAFNLFKTTDASEIESFNNFRVYNGLFDEKSARQTFYIDDLDNTDNVVLTFLTKERDGVLVINLNGITIFESEIDTLNVEPIKLRKDRLSEGENVLDFSVSGVGAAFWKTNEYSFEGVRVIGDVTDVSRQETTNVFTLETWKANNIDDAKLKYSPECKQSEVGTLEIDVNSKTIFSGVPDCGLLNTHSIPDGILESGTNTVVFKTNKGSYLVDRIIVDVELEELSSPLYWFELTKAEFKNISRGDVDVNLTLEFVDTYYDCDIYRDRDCDSDRNTLDLNINGHLTRVDEDEAFYSKNITNWVEEGQNYVRLTARKNSVDVVNIQVFSIEYEDDDD